MPSAWRGLMPVLACACAAAFACGGDITYPRPDSPVMLNEIDCHGRDWVEIVNRSDEAAAIAGWVLADRMDRADHRYVLPEGILLAAGERLIVRQQTDTESGFPFGIGCGDDTLFLVHPDGRIMDVVRVGEPGQGCTWGRYPDRADNWQETSPTAGMANQQSPAAAAVLFERWVVSEFALEIPQASMDALAASPYDWVEARLTVTAGGQVVGPLPIGVRLKGGASFRPLGRKASFRLDFNRVVDGQRMLGLKALVLNGMVHDPTGMHETLAYSVFRAAGVPAARTGYTRLAVNGQDYGLYLAIEAYDDVFGDMNFDSTLHVYEGVGNFLPGFEAKAVQVDEGDPDHIEDLHALATAAHGTGDDAWMATVAERLDLPAFLRYWAEIGRASCRERV